MSIGLWESFVTRVEWPSTWFYSRTGVMWMVAFPLIYATAVNYRATKASRHTRLIDRDRLLPWLGGWNFFMCAFSGVGFVVILVSFIANRGTDHLICEMTWAHHPFVMATIFLFMVMKPIEFIDTGFLVANGKSVPLLHWFHHTTVTLFCWHTGAVNYQMGMGAIFAGMNYGVHCLMYGYYGLRTFDVSLPSFVPLIITGLQVMQMVAGLAVLIIARSCAKVDLLNIVMGLLMYGAYFVLFTRYFLARYVDTQVPTTKAN